jgi:hypothetical protein
MSKVHEAIDDRLREFILAQPMFFVGTAPSDVDGHVNVSPKGMAGCFAVLGPHRVAYLDFGGSGAETIAHLRDNGRIVLMFCAFQGPPNIVRLHGRGTVHRPGEPRYGELEPRFPAAPGPGRRTVIEVEVTRVSDSCGFAVPLMRHEADRDLLTQFWSRKSPAETRDYWIKKNSASIDGLPALEVDPH